MKKKLLVLLTLIFVLSVSSCSLNNNETNPHESSSLVTAQTPETTTASEKDLFMESFGDFFETDYSVYDDITAQYPDKTVLTWIVNSGSSYFTARTEKINEYLDSQGYDFAVCFIPLFTSSFIEPELFYIDRVEEIIADGRQADILCCETYGIGEGVVNAYHNFVQHGLLDPLNSYLESPAGQELYELMPENHWESLRVNGSIYGVDGKMVSVGEDYGYYVNADLAEKYGFDVSRPIEDQLDILKEIKENETCDIFTLGDNKLWDPTLYFTSAKKITQAVYWDTEVHTAKCILDNPEFLEKLCLFDTLSKNGLLTKATAGTGTSFFIAQVHVANGSVIYNPFSTVDFDYKGDSGDLTKVWPVYSEHCSISNSYNATGICSASQNKDKAFELLALTQTDPYLNNLMIYGLEGEDYNMTEDGKVVQINFYDFDFYRYANYMICCQNTDYRGFGPNITADEYKAVYENAVIDEDFDFAFDCSGFDHEINAISAIMEGFRLPSKDQTLEEALSEFREKLEYAGLQKIIDECNRQYEEYKENKNES